MDGCTTKKCGWKGAFGSSCGDCEHLHHRATTVSPRGVSSCSQSQRAEPPNKHPEVVEDRFSFLLINTHAALCVNEHPNLK